MLDKSRIKWKILEQSHYLLFMSVLSNGRISGTLWYITNAQVTQAAMSCRHIYLCITSDIYIAIIVIIQEMVIIFRLQCFILWWLLNPRVLVKKWFLKHVSTEYTECMHHNEDTRINVVKFQRVRHITRRLAYKYIKPTLNDMILYTLSSNL